jgi:hypothetical protein
MTFTRNIENFVCEHCKASVQGDGFTNHCPYCLWSKHVDVDPGDRAEHCHGMMEPVGIEGSSPEYRLVHRCLMCGTKRQVRLSSNDDTEKILGLAGKAMP